MDFEADMDEHVSYGRFIKTETADIAEEPPPFEENELNSVMEKLELIPIVYTTRLDDMKVLKPYSVQSCPKKVTASIIKESRPSLQYLPSKKTERNKKRFEDIKIKLSYIYASYRNVHIKEEIDIPDASTIQIDPNSIKSEVLDAPVFEKAKPKDTRPNSELLKLCKPCSVVLPVISPPFIIHGGQLLQTNKVKPVLPVVPPTIELSSDEDDPKPSCPDLEVALNTIKDVADKLNFEFLESKKSNSDKRKAKRVPFSTVAANMEEPNAVNILHNVSRLLRNSSVKINDAFSKEFHLYYTDHDSNLLDYIKGTTGNVQLYEMINKEGYRYIVHNCCWIKKEEYIKSLYPKVLAYSISRFMRKPHPCKPGACECCCRKKENIKKPDLLITGEKQKNRKMLQQEDKEILDLEDEIDKSIINIKRTPKFSSADWLRKLESKNRMKEPKTLIQKALAYNKPRPKIVTDNRRLYTLKKGDSQTSVVSFGNFAKDLTEIYEINAQGQIESYIKTTCFNNAMQPGVKRLLNKPNAITETICCWFKREEVINMVQHTKALHATAVKFMKTNHSCPVNECSCCCKPQTKEKLKLIDVMIPKRLDWSENIIESSKLPKNNLLKPLASSANSASVRVKKTKSQRSVHLSKPSTSRDEDCQITSIMKSPMLRPTSQTPTIPATCTIPVVGTTPEMLSSIVDNDELSQEVNALITSILDRFKDVRLTINNEGKVSASLNTPINTLSTVELKVLANILSFAQTQVNSLGFNVKSGMSLSNIINLKVDDVNNTGNTALDSKTVYKAFGQNVNLNNSPQEVPHLNNKNSAPFTTSSLPKVPELPNIPQTYNFFTNSTSVRNQHFNEAFSTFINSRIESNSDATDVNNENETMIPVIEDVFSIKEEPEDTDPSTTVWCRKPVRQQSVSTASEDKSETSNNSRKRTESTDSSMLSVKKIRILSPANLSVANADSQTTVNAQPVPGTVRVGGFMTGVPVLPNNNFRVIGQTQTTGNLMPVIPPPPLTQTRPILIINPLNTPNLIDTGGTVSVPYTRDSNIQNVATVTHPESNMPVVTNATNVFSLDENPPTVKSIIISHVTSGSSEAEFVNVNTGETDDLIVENDEEVDPKEEFGEDDGQEAEDFENNDVIENIEDIDEVECVDNETEEEDCILGF